MNYCTESTVVKEQKALVKRIVKYQARGEKLRSKQYRKTLKYYENVRTWNRIRNLLFVFFKKSLSEQTVSRLDSIIPERRILEDFYRADLRHYGGLIAFYALSMSIILAMGIGILTYDFSEYSMSSVEQIIVQAACAGGIAFILFYTGQTARQLWVSLQNARANHSEMLAIAEDYSAKTLDVLSVGFSNLRKLYGQLGVNEEALENIERSLILGSELESIEAYQYVIDSGLAFENIDEFSTSFTAYCARRMEKEPYLQNEFLKIIAKIKPMILKNGPKPLVSKALEGDDIQPSICAIKEAFEASMSEKEIISLAAMLNEQEITFELHEIKKETIFKNDLGGFIIDKARTRTPIIPDSEAYVLDSKSLEQIYFALQRRQF